MVWICESLRRNAVKFITNIEGHRHHVLIGHISTANVFSVSKCDQATMLNQDGEYGKYYTCQAC